MARTEVRGGQIKDTSVQRADLDTSTTGQAVVTRIVAGNNINLGSTGVDSGTGDVTINVTTPGLIRSVNVISTSQTLGSNAGTEYIYLASGTITLTLPTAVGNTNRYTIKNSGTGIITINTTSNQRIDGDLVITIFTSKNSVDLLSDGSNWNII